MRQGREHLETEEGRLLEMVLDGYVSVIERVARLECMIQSKDRVLPAQNKQRQRVQRASMLAGFGVVCFTIGRFVGL